MTPPPPLPDIWGPNSGKKAAVALSALAFGAAGCGGDDDDEATVAEQEEATTAPSEDQQGMSVSTFVGIAEGSDEVVAVTLTDDGAFEAYFCDGKEVGEFFEGALDGDSLSARSERDAELEATVGDDTVEGTVRLAGGEPLSFTAGLNDEAAIYLVDISDDGEITGSSTGGGTLDIDSTGKRYEGTVTYPSGERAELGGRFGSGAEVDAEGHRDTLASGGEVDAEGDGTFSIYLAGKPTQNDIEDAAGEYRFTVADGIIVGRGIKGGTLQRFVSECPD